MDATKAQVTIIAEEEKPAKKIEDDEDDLKEQLLQTIGASITTPTKASSKAFKTPQ